MKTSERGLRRAGELVAERDVARAPSRRSPARAPSPAACAEELPAPRPKPVDLAVAAGQEERRTSGGSSSTGSSRAPVDRLGQAVVLDDRVVRRAGACPPARDARRELPKPSRYRSGSTAGSTPPLGPVQVTASGRVDGASGHIGTCGRDVEDDLVADSDQHGSPRIARARPGYRGRVVRIVTPRGRTAPSLRSVHRPGAGAPVAIISMMGSRTIQRRSPAVARI